MDWHHKAEIHALEHRMVDGLFVRDRCIYCGLATIDFCPECAFFVCRRCDTLKHWPAVCIYPDIGLGWRGRWRGGRR